jgi:hypothetical protein
VAAPQLAHRKACCVLYKIPVLPLRGSTGLFHCSIKAMTEEHFSPQESLRLIQSMIDKTRENISGNTHYFLLWGWLTFIGCTGQFILKNLLKYDKHYQIWLITIIGVISSVYFSVKWSKRKRVKTYVDESMRYLWTGMACSFAVLSAIFTKTGWGSNVFPFFILLYGLGTFVSGCFLKFKPLMAGGILAWVIAVVAVFLSYDYQLLAGGAAILVSYIIPGHLLNRKSATTKTAFD